VKTKELANGWTLVEVADLRIRVLVEYGNDADYSKLDEWQQGANPWTIVIKVGNRRPARFHYWTGPMAAEPNPVEALGAIISDAHTYAEFERLGIKSSQLALFENWS
jgi:hypothetical protein